MAALIMAALVTEGADPITAFLTRDWAALGGWGCFLTLVFIIVFGSFKGWWVAGWLYRAQAKTLDEAMAQNRTLLVTADITKHFYETVGAKKGGDAE